MEFNFLGMAFPMLVVGTTRLDVGIVY